MPPDLEPDPVSPRLERPIFIVAPAGSGASHLLGLLAGSPSIWTAAADRQEGPAIEEMPALHPANRGWDSDRLTSSDAVAPVGVRFRERLGASLSDAGGARADDRATGLRLLDPNLRNALSVPFLDAVFPRAVFVYLYRDPREAIEATLEGWESTKRVTYAELPGWEGPPWSYLLTPEWRGLAGRSLPEICVQQWSMTTRILLGDLERLAPERWCVVDHGALRTAPERELERLAEFAEIEAPPGPVNLPDDDAGIRELRRFAEIDPVADEAFELAERARELIADPSATRAAEPVDLNSPTSSPLRSVNSSNLVDILDQLRSSLLVSTYQTGKVVAIRKDGDGVNTHFRQFENPMGVDMRGGRLAIGTKSQVLEYHNVPSLSQKLEPAGKHDACFVPRRSHYTGDIRIHEIAYAESDLWLVNTRFSCLCTLDNQHSFIPRWRPPFISKLAAEDRCHLNGLAVVDDRVRYVSMLGTSDEAGGWREDKAGGGILMDVGSNEIVASGLSMPHSPRWYRDELWVLESGEGAIGRVELDTGRIETVAKLPGFTRGLSFAGPLAFIGLSEVRESTTFGGLPLTGRLEERQCGVWVVNIETGQTIAFLRFEDLVQEIFAVMVLPEIRFPEIAEHGSKAVDLTYVLPDAALADTA